MKCPTCNANIDCLKRVELGASMLFRKFKQCPHCGVTIYRQNNPTWEYFKLIIFINVWFGVFLFLLAVIFGRQVGYKTALIICFWFWVLVVLVFLLIFVGNLTVIFLQKAFNKR
jgi:hypothetical protein